MTSQWKYWETKTVAVHDSFVQLRTDKVAARKAFWKWYGKIQAEAAAEERSRIIKLLKDSKCECASLSVDDWVEYITERGNFLKHAVCGSEADTIDEAIALIKGENK